MLQTSYVQQATWKMCGTLTTGPRELVRGSSSMLLLPDTGLPDDVINDDGFRWHEQRMEPLRDLRKLHALRLKDL